jgi:hypothetical protein
MADQTQSPMGLSSEAIQMLVTSLTQNGHAQLEEIQVERFLNALARVQSGVPTGVPSNVPTEKR